jgi:hypothetical protein
LSLQDIPDVIRWSVRYDLPFGADRARLQRGILSQIAGGWAVASFLTWDNGLPIRLQSPNDSNSFGGGAGMRPNVTGASPALDPPSLTDSGAYFNAAAFARTAPFAFGTATRTIDGVRAPGGRNLDLLIEKRFAIHAQAHVDFRIEIFNALNTVQFAGPVTDITSAAFGRIFLQQVDSPRQVQIGARLSF